MKRRITLFLLVAVVVTAAAAVGSWITLERYAAAPAGEVNFTIPSGSGLAQTSRALEQAGAISPGESRLFMALALLRGHERAIKAGNYRVKAGETIGDLLSKIASGTVEFEKFTIVEGSTFGEIKAQLAADPRVENLTTGMSDDEILEAVGAAEGHPEGLFLAETYLFEEGASDVTILRQAYGMMGKTLDDAWSARAPDLPFESPYEALVLASIVEKEAGRADERGLIASVFVNRLRRGMRLQADPTVIYGLGASFDGNLTRKNLRSDTPYNTYTRGGVPPTPIALPGPDAVAAVLAPPETKYYYFVATGEGGAHYFSQNLREHNNAVNKYQRGK